MMEFDRAEACRIDLIDFDERCMCFGNRLRISLEVELSSVLFKPCNNSSRVLSSYF